MSNHSVESEYLKDDSLTSTSSSKETIAEKTENITSNISLKADRAIDKSYSTDVENTETDDIKTYGLSKPKRVIITGITKND